MRALQREAPAPNEPSERPCLFEEDEADFLVGLFDRRLLALKCVVSDSKEAGAARLQEAVQAAKRLGGRYDTDQLVAIAVQWLFTAKDIEAAQATAAG